MIRPAQLIERKRDGGQLTAEEIRELVLGYTRGEIPEYQMSAFLMAVYFRGLSGAETFALTDAMIASGETIDLGAATGRRCVDKHSTGGVGDKTSIAVGPIVAACGVPFGKMSGRGLGHTGGTIDKLEAIPGYRVELTTDEFVDQVREVGIAIIGQTANLVPADKQLYALRDVTATVDNVSLIAASIMSKKLAGGADAMLLDVKVGDGAFMKTIDDARTLAEAMIELGDRADRRVVCMLTDMDQPLGQAVGNALEIREAVATIKGDGPPDFTELVLGSVAHLLSLSDLGLDEFTARRVGEEAVADGSALAAYERWIEAQGGDPDLDSLPRARGRPRGDRYRRRRRPEAWSHRRWPRRPPPGRRPADEGGSDRLRRGRRLPEEAGRRGRARGGARGGARVGRCLCGGGRGRGAGGVRARRRSAGGAANRARHDRLVPELPEVETERGRLAARLEGRRITAARIDDPRLTRPDEPAWIAARLSGERVDAVERRGKYLVVRLAGGQVLLVHLRMTGGFRYEPASHERAVLELDDGTRIAYRDVRRFGTWLLLDPNEAEDHLGIRLGPEPLERRFTAAYLAGRLAGRKAPVKAAVLDQRTVAGLGNIYADESLWHARIHPLRPAGELSAEEVGTPKAGHPAGVAPRHPPPGGRPRRRHVRRRADAARVPRLRPQGRALRPVRHADREDPRRRSRHLVLPDLPGLNRPSA